MKQRSRARKEIKYCVCLCLLLLSGCRKSGVLLDTDHITVTRSGAQTLIYDRISDESYTLYSHRKRAARQTSTTASLVIDTETIKVENAYGMLIVEDKTDKKIYYIRRRSWPE